MDSRAGTLFRHSYVRYLFAIALVASAFALRLWLIPFTGTGAPFVLFFAAILVTSLVAGVGPGICAVVLSAPLGAYTFVMSAGYSFVQASFQSLLFAVDGTVAVYLTFLMKKTARLLQNANRQLRESEEKYRTLFDSIDEGFCVIEVLFDDADTALDYRFLEVNRVFEKQTGISNAVGRRMREIAPAHEEHWFQIYGQVALTGESRRFENPAAALGRFYDVYAFRVGRPDQRKVAILFNDITKRKQAEEELHRTLALNQAVLGSLTANIAVLDREGNIVAVNDAWKRFGYENDGAAVADSVGVNYLQVCSDAPEGRNGASVALNGIQAVLNGTRDNFVHEYPCHSPSEKRWFLMSVTPLRGERGGAVVAHTDITSRKQIEEALKETEERLELAMEAGRVGTFDWDIRTNAVVWTDLSKVAFGRPSEVSRGTYDDWAKQVRGEDRLAWEATIQEALRNKHDHWQAEYRIISADTTDERWISSQSHIFYDAHGGPLRMIGVNIDMTERKRIERALQESEELFRLTIDGAPIGMALVTLDGHFVRVNSAFCEIVGYSSDELMGLTFQAITHPADVDADLTARDQLAREEILRYQRGKRYIRKDGTVVDVQLSVSMLRGRDGAPLFFVSQIEDITERKRAEEAVHASERELRELAESMPQIVWATDADGLNIYFNQQWVDYTGLTLDESYGDGWIKPFHPDDRQRAWDAWHGATQHRDIYSLECRLRRADGMYRWWLIRGVPLLNANGEIRKWFGTCTDIEQIKRIENELKAANAFLDAVIEHIPLALFLKDAKSLRYLRLNRAGEDMLGWPKETFVGKNDYDLWPRAQAKFFVEKDREALKETLIDIPEEPVQTRYRGVRLMHTKKVSILDMTGQPIYLLGISEDITESKRIEREQQFLAEVTVALSASLDYEQTLAAVAQLVVQHVADWCAVDVMDEHGRLSRLKVASADPAKAALCALLEQMPPDRHLPHFVESVSESGRPILVEHVTSEWVESFAQTPEHLQAVTATGVISLIAVPLAMRGQPLGVLVFGSSTLSRVFGHGDLRLAEAVADRAAIAIENARLYQASVRAAQFQQVLSEVGAMLASSLDYEQTLTTVAQLVVRDFADWCLIEVIDEREQMKRRRIVARDPAKADLCAVLEHMTIDRQRPHLLRAVFDTKQSLLIEHVTSEHIESAAQGPEHLQALRAVNPTSLMAVPLLRHGRLLGILTFVSSTESRRYGSSDLHLAEALAERAAIAIENARLYRASTHATQLRDQVLGVVAHDLRNPLSAIRMRASLLTRHGAEPERRSQKPLEAIERAVMHMNRLIQDLLDVALMEAGQLTIERARLSARGMMVEAVDMQRSLASSSSLELRIEADSNVPDIWGDRDRLLQVFENLIGNAIKFTKAGGCITVGAASHDHEVIFRVADTGSGIAPEDLPRVFDRFWQATRANRQGAGLGLPITKGIVEAHGGRIWVESTPNRGTTFSFTIPETTSEQGRPSGSSGSSLVEGDRAA